MYILSVSLTPFSCPPSVSAVVSVVSVLQTNAVVAVVPPRDLEFESDQRAHQQSQLQKLCTAHQDIVDIMTRVYDTFRSAGAEVHKISLLRFPPVRQQFMLTLCHIHGLRCCNLPVRSNID